MKVLTDKIDKKNFSSWNKNKSINFYRSQTGLQKPEEIILQRVRKEIIGKKILDIGVGGGRTVAYLIELSRDYRGIDYSPGMIEICRKIFPGQEFINCDARDLSLFQDEDFDFIFFSYNGIDYISHADRLRSLREIYRVLKRGGSFAFSSHNRGVKKSDLVKLSSLDSSANPNNPLKHFISFMKDKINHLRNRRYEIHTKEYAIVNEPGNHYALLSYSITIETQIKQLTEVGFLAPVRTFNLEGKEVLKDSESPWIYYWAKK